ncbi:MAG: M28 family peptidase [Acidobacteria bacterium]|nr:M28 family peptidase [Acidobacteriota bacterium]
MRFTILLVTFCGFLHGQTGADAIQASRMRADLFFLASEALEGRMSLQRGSEAAIEWIASEFAKAGLKPANGASFFQKTPLIEYRMDRNQTRLVVKRGDLTSEYQFPDAGISFPDDIAISGAAVFAGFGITAPEYGYDDYAGVDARGKIVLIFDHEPQERDPRSVFKGKGNTLHAGSYVKALNAQKHGALAVLIAAEPNRKHLSNQERLARVPGSPMRQARVPSQALAEREVRIPSISITDKVAAELMAGSGKTLAELETAIDAGLKPASMGLGDTRVEIRAVTSERRRGISSNVAGLVEGSDPLLKDETIVFSAHYDHDGVLADGLRPGADDNGSGTVGVVELARAFGALGEKPRRSLLLIVFAAEERGLLGSYYYTMHPLRPLATTRAMINFDMIGRNETPSRQTDGLIDIDADTSNEMNLVGAYYSPEYREFVERSNARIGLRLNYKWDEEAALNVFFRSDQYPFVLRGIPAVWWFTGFHPDYHQTTDMADKINYAKMEKIVRLAFLTGLEFANTARPPKFQP